MAPDQRGIGLSSKPEGAAACRIDALAADVVALVKALGRERMQVVGHDRAGVFAGYLAAHHAEVVSSAARSRAATPARCSTSRTPRIGWRAKSPSA